eukprot:151100-Chlamydomonas_euryale.AAC.1
MPAPAPRSVSRSAPRSAARWAARSSLPAGTTRQTRGRADARKPPDVFACPRLAHSQSSLAFFHTVVGRCHAEEARAPVCSEGAGLRVAPPGGRCLCVAGPRAHALSRGREQPGSRSRRSRQLRGVGPLLDDAGNRSRQPHARRRARVRSTRVLARAELQLSARRRPLCLRRFHFATGRRPQLCLRLAR